MEIAHEYEKYKATKNTLQSVLDQYGVAIIPNVIDEKECEEMKKGMWNYLEHITQNADKKILENDKNTWKNISSLFTKHSMLIQQWGVGHAQYAWDLRQKEKIVNIFAKLWNCEKEDLLVSFDGLSFHMPPEITGEGWYKNNGWLHTDISYTRSDEKSIQSWITANDVNNGDATLTVLESSHLYHKEFGEHFGITDKSDWYVIDKNKDNDEEMKFYKDKGCVQKYIKCPKGSMVFWKSQTIHSGIEAIKTREKENIRCVSYLCYVPRNMATERDLRKKIKAFETLRTTSHYPHKIKMFPKIPRTYGSPVPNITDVPKPILTDLGKKLAGL